MKNIMMRITEGLKSSPPRSAPGGREVIITVSPHRLIRIEDISCIRHEDSVLIRFSIRNLGGEVPRYGLKVINNFDHEGREYEYSFSFGRAGSSVGPMLQNTLPHDIPIKVTVRLFGIGSRIRSIAQIKMAGLYLRKRSARQYYNPSGIILLKNIAIDEP